MGEITLPGLTDQEVEAYREYELNKAKVALSETARKQRDFLNNR